MYHTSSLLSGYYLYIKIYYVPILYPRVVKWRLFQNQTVLFEQDTNVENGN